MNKFDSPFTYFIFNKNLIENTEPLEELIRERNSYLKNDNNFINFWSISLNKLKKEKFIELIIKLGLEKELNNIKKFDEDYLILFTTDEIFSNWLSLKLPDVLEVNNEKELFIIDEKNSLMYNGYKYNPTNTLDKKLYYNPLSEVYLNIWKHMY